MKDINEIIKLIENEKKDIGYDSKEKPDLTDEFLALAFDSNADAWFNGFDNGLDKAVSIIKEHLKVN